MDQCVSFWFIFFYCFLVPTTAIKPSNYTAGGTAFVSCMHNTTDATALSSFKQNLRTAFLTLTTNQYSQRLKYDNISAGSGKDTAYAMYQCRGDQTIDSCWQCLVRATRQLPDDDCPSSIGARIQFDECYLRYDNESFFTPDFSFVIGYCYAPSNDSVTLEVISSLVQNVTTQAPEQEGFASAEAEGEYAVAQCLGYLTKFECSQCLSSVPYTTLCDSTLGEQVHLTSCYYRFEPYMFLDQPATPPLDLPNSNAAPPLDLPNSNATPPLVSPLRKSTDLKSILGVAFGVGALSVAALCMGLLWRYKRKKGRQEEYAEEEGWHGL